MLEDDLCYHAVCTRDAAFDGLFVMAVTTTGIYCRPSCPARRAARAHYRFYPSAEEARRAGFRACKRCRPDAVAFSPEWDARADLAARALQLIEEGEVDRAGVGGLARRLGYSERQLRRHVRAELGTTPLVLARRSRVRRARELLSEGRLSVTQVAFEAGFSSLRQFNASIRATRREEERRDR